MAMDPVLVQAIKDRHKLCHLVTVVIGGDTVRWMLEGGYVYWSGDLYQAKDPTYGALNGISEIVDGIEEDANTVTLGIIPPSLASLAAIAAADVQGGAVEIHLAAIHNDTGQLVGEPYRLHLGVLDRPSISVSGDQRVLDYDVIGTDAYGLEVNEEQRQTHAFRQLRFPGDLGDQYATDGPKVSYWRADEPREAVGLLSGRGGKAEDLRDNKALEFSYEPEAPLAFPMGRCSFAGAIRYRCGYGPTNRWYSVIATFGASGPIAGLVSVLIDDKVTTFDGSDRALDGAHVGEMWFDWRAGAQPSTALTSPTGTNAPGIDIPGWTSDHKLSGSAAFCWTGKENSKEDEFRGGVSRIKVTYDGLLGWDPTDVASDLDDPSTWAFIDDGARWALNWAIGRWEGSDGGMTPKYGVPYTTVLVGGIGAPLTGIDVDAFEAAAGIADDHGWKVSAVPFSDLEKVDVLEDLLKAAGAWRSRKCGMLSCVSFAAARESVVSFTEADTAGTPTVELGRSRLDRRNAVIARFKSADHGDEMVPITAIQNAAWVTDDGQRRTLTSELRYVPDKDQAAPLGYYDLANARETGADVPMMPWAMAAEPGDCVDWDEPELLLEGKFMVFRRAYNPASSAVRMEFRTETDAKHTDALAQTGTVPDPSDPVDPPGPYVEPPSMFSTANGDEVISIFWRNPGSPAFDHVSVMWAVGSTDIADAVEIDTGGLEGLSAMEAVNYVPLVAGVHSFWVVAWDALGNASEALGPESETVVLLLTSDAGEYLTDDAGIYLSAD